MIGYIDFSIMCSQGSVRLALPNLCHIPLGGVLLCVREGWRLNECNALWTCECLYLTGLWLYRLSQVLFLCSGIEWSKNDELDQNHKHRHAGAARRRPECSLSRGWWWYIWGIKLSRAPGHQLLLQRAGAGGKRVHSDQTVCWDAQRGSGAILQKSLLQDPSRDHFLADHRMHPGSDCHDHYDRGAVASMHELVAADSGLSGLSSIIQRFKCWWCWRPQR